MGEWSDFFEDFPEQNPANYVNETFNPKLASAIRDQKRQQIIQQRAANAEVNTLITQAQIDAKARSLLVIEICPQCLMKELNTYKFNDDDYLCECQSCGINGKGTTHKMALDCISDEVWNERLDIKQIIRD